MTIQPRNDIKGAPNGNDHDAQFDPRSKWPLWIGIGGRFHRNSHTNGIESFWSMLKRGYQGTFHHFSEKHLDRYVGEFAGRHDIRNADTGDQMGIVARQSVRKRLRYADLVS